ncbi:TRAP transporter small permease [Sulfitobacter guttiformis]|uniref:TRAP transporter small permease protein n=1 Tax=Sulfitobacter guttiformis TaxID=74349 RepID=A0A420DJ44_9RHOB|nr:TRAP transporter small permease [Sulfitobacter guttiformis]KIN71960.1 Tripartite ATP-independent periplasmic transporter DctQ component [Sulfitobacter guttiformis KCTC 32187]RKE94241.1 TRAP-type C4-dicarboxylate transport system permease small subunit [Sulfitobacter guttiformis]
MINVIKNLEEILASIAISITVILVIINVVLRYGFGFIMPWGQELAVLCFIWAVYLGISSCYKHNLHMGVDAILSILPTRLLAPFKLLILFFLLGLNVLLTYLSYEYTMLSNKTTPVMGISYFWVNIVLIFCFGLMALHTVRMIVNDIKTLKAEA